MRCTHDADVLAYLSVTSHQWLSNSLSSHFQLPYRHCAQQACAVVLHYQISVSVKGLRHRVDREAHQLYASCTQCVHLFRLTSRPVCRLLSPLLLRQLLLWLEGNKAYGSKGGYPVGMGWLWAILLGMSGYLSTLTHHQAFWYAWDAA